MEGHRDLVIGSNERSWSVDVPFDHFGQNTLPEVVKLTKIAQNSGFSRHELVRARTFERKGLRDLVIGSNERSWSIDMPFDHLDQQHPTGSCQIGQKKSCFHRKYI